MSKNIEWTEIEHVWPENWPFEESRERLREINDTLPDHLGWVRLCTNNGGERYVLLDADKNNE